MRRLIRELLISIYRALDRKRKLFPNGINRTLNFGHIKLNTNILDAGGYTYYNSRKSYEEYMSKLYYLINTALNPKIILDIGANYGFISSISASKMPQAKIIAIEPSKKLIPYIEKNFRLNDVKNYEILNSVCGDDDRSSYSFSINPFSSQDNRVLSPKSNWLIEKSNMISIDSILKNTTVDEPVFIKIDTQGFEQKVFAGGKSFLGSNKNWIIKTEFGPHWIKSQNSDPLKFLSDLVNRYEVAELPATIPYLTNNISDLFNFSFDSMSVEGFIKYLEKLDKNNLGWCDLIIRPKKNVNKE